MIEAATDFTAQSPIEKKSRRERTKHGSELTVQVANDLQKALTLFRDPKKGLKLLSRKMDIHEKTLKRLLQQEHSPGYITLYKIYRILVPAANDTELLDKVPTIVRDYLVLANPQPQTGTPVIYTGDLEKELLADRVFAEIYFISSCGAIRRDEILDRYGKHGLGVMARMCALGVLKEVKPNLFTLGDKQVNLTARGLKQAGLALADSFADIERVDEYAENYLSLYSEGLSRDAYDEWIRIDEEAFRKKLEVCKRPMALGNIRAFTFTVTDKMLPHQNPSKELQ